MELLLVGDVWWMESHFLALSPMSWKCLDINLRDVDELDDVSFQTGCFKLEPPSGTSNWNLQIVPPTGTTKMNHQLEVDQLQSNIH